MNKTKYMVGRLLSFLPDKTYLSLLYYSKFRKWINWKDPKSFNEKLQWLKVNYRDDSLSDIVDKVNGKARIAQLIGDEYNVPTIGVYDSFDEIPFDELPNRFVLKCTHDSGCVFICKDKSRFNIEEARREITAELNRNLYYLSREWPYKHVKPRIIIEGLLENSDGSSLDELKCFCFNGKVKMILVCQGTAHDTTGSRTNDFYDLDNRHLPVKCLNPWAAEPYVFPDHIDQLIQAAEKLSAGFPHMRVDSYVVNGQFYIGEMTFFHNSGLRKFEPEVWDDTFGDWIELPKKA